MVHELFRWFIFVFKETGALSRTLIGQTLPPGMKKMSAVPSAAVMLEIESKCPVKKQ